MSQTLMTSQVEKEHRTNNSDTAAVTPRLYQWYSRRAGIGRWLNSERRRIASYEDDGRLLLHTARRAPQNSNGREQFVPLGETVLDCRCASLKQRQQSDCALPDGHLHYMYIKLSPFRSIPSYVTQSTNLLYFTIFIQFLCFWEIMFTDVYSILWYNINNIL